MPIDMPNPKLFKPSMPRAPRMHALFGTKYFKVHRFMDEKWPPTFLTTQYSCMVGALEKHMEFKVLEKEANRRKQRATYNSLRIQCRDGRTRLKMAHQGDQQRIRNILHNDLELQRLYQNMPSHLMVDNINQRTFVRRKERDRLKHELGQLMKQYEEKLIEKSKLEDRITYQNEFILPEEIDSKECRKNITISVTRVRAFKTIKRAYTKIIQALMQDAIYYEPVLDSLEQDIEEQSNFIQHIVMLGIPAMGKLKILMDEYQKMENITRMRLKENMKFLFDFKKKVISDSDQVKKIVRAAGESTGPKRKYDRETTSMTDLRLEKEEIEKVIRELQTATLVKPKQIYPRMKSVLDTNINLRKQLTMNEKILDLKADNVHRADAKNESLKHNLTDEEIERLQEIDDLQQQIKEEKKIQNECNEFIQNNGEVFTNLKSSLYNIIDVLRHVGKPLKAVKRIYPNEELKLPLLKFDAKPALSFPPDAVEENSEKLMELATDKVKTLMKEYKVEASPAQLKEAVDECRKIYIESVAKEEEMGEAQAKEEPLIPFAETKDDPNVVTRKQIKDMSKKMVEENKKEMELL